MVFRRRDDDGFGTTSFWELLASPFLAVRRALSFLSRRDDGFDQEQSLVMSLFGLLTFPLRLFWGFLVFMVQAWPQSRSGFAFLRSVPAILGIGTFLGGLLAADLFITEARRIGSAQSYLAYHNLNSPDHPEYALMFAQKLIEIKPDVPEHKYQLGLAYDRVGNMFRAFDAMESIVLDDESDLTRALVWLSQYYQRSNLIEMDQEERERKAREFLARAVGEDTADDQLANFDLARLYLTQANRLEKETEQYNETINSAIESLRLVVEGPFSGLQLEAVPMLAGLEIKHGNPEEARTRLNYQISKLRNLAQKRPNVIQVWVSMVRCAILLKDFKLASEIVVEGQQLVDDLAARMQLLRMASGILVKQADEYRDMGDPNQYRNRVHALCQAIQVNQRDRIVYLNLLDFVVPPVQDETGSGQQPSDNKQTRNARQSRPDFSESERIWLNDAMIGCRSPEMAGVIHAMLGMREIADGNVSDGEKHWRISDKQLPGRAKVVVNQLIDVAAMERPSDFPNMLDMITLGIEMFPDEPVYYQTRGVFLMGQGKYDEAVKDLVYASEKLPQNVVLDKYLVDCYEKLGNQRKKLDHEIILEEKLSTLANNERKIVEANLKLLDEE